VAAHERKTREKCGWNEIPADLPREEVIIDVPEAEREGMELIGYEVSERVARRDTRFFVKVIKRAKYADKSDALRGVVTAPAAGDVLDSASGKTKFDVSFISGVVSDKIENHLPLYRQAEMMAREGLPIHRSTLCHLFGGAAEPLTVLYDRMDELIMAGDIIHADETLTKLLEPGHKKCKTAYVWGRMSGLGPPLIVFHFERSRSKETAQGLYGDYFGTIIRDAYAGYEDLEAGFAACWAHVRRKLFDAWNAGYLEADTGIKIIRQLYLIEAEAKTRAEKKGTETALFQERKTARRPSSSLVRDFFDFCRRQRDQEIPSSPLRKAVNYALNLESALSEFLTNPKLNIDNNPMENMIRPIALGRKNWLFAGSEGGGQHLAILQSFAATCKANQVNFRAWLEDVLLRLSTTPAADIDTLLPHLWQPAR
jgi:transposase